MDPSFVQLLNDGVYNDNEEMNSQTPLSSQPQDLTSKSKKGRNQSGVSEEDKIREACSMYQKIQGSSFPYMHCWTELRHSPKFAPNQPKSKKNKTSPNDESPTTPSSGGSPASVNFEIENDDMTERPLGRKAAKRLKKLNLESKEDAFKVLLTEMKENLTSTA
ncbi:hypothetical protein POM88_034018 [Heracleum sosnowskyi]|uniref:No apical meristem-associated C-terminal domain-containing protein n=1 Tax=Heracleum sosnowskyi TaxID=360622 RepID=A0AAD8HIQ9_9APIA|nr:hypothetical protein POM88_034018 [Heracleum sosnowskyi]